MTASDTTAVPALRPLRVGLTGGIASGKSEVSRQFAALGVPVIDADVIAREVVAPGTALLQQLLDRFAPSALQRYGEPLQRDGDLDRALLRRLVFDDPLLRQELETLMHPAIRARSEALAEAAGGPYQIHVIPLLIETGAQARFDRILVVDCPSAVQLSRLMSRDRLSAEQAQAMLAAQTERTARLSAADDVITNDGALDALRAQVLRLHNQYLALVAQPRRDG